ncbi:MAG TPA: hypothetical protein VME42_05320 [Steroidobacteraceae bacterium]|nr:hypothetical protein [Steroidobacteraceae bacterium]
MRTCPHRPPCPGCPRFAEPGIAAVHIRALDALAAAHGLPAVPIFSASDAGFRHRARLAIRGRVGAAKVGLFELGTHRVVHIPHCSVHHPLINRVAAVVRAALSDETLTCYSDGAHLGIARYLQVVVERASQSAQVVLVANSPTIEPLTGCFERIRERLPSELHSLWFSAHTDRSNTILGPSLERWHGPESVIEHFGGAGIHYPPGAFGQSNLQVAQAIIGYLRAQIPAGSRISEFYAGVGAIGLSLLDGARELRMNESNPHSLRGLELGLAQLDAPSRARVSVLAGTAAAAREAACEADVVIADPPRKGLDRALCEILGDRPPALFLYVSCSLDSFMQDLERLTSRGRLRLTAMRAFDLFPFTAHLETVARFEPRT